MRDQGFISYFSLLLVFLIVSVFSAFFFTQSNYIRKADEKAISNRIEAHKELSLALKGGQEILGRVDRGLSQAPVGASLTQALNSFLFNYGSNTFDCPTGSTGEREKTAIFVLYPTSYQNAQGSCGEIVKAIAASVFPQFPQSPSLTSSRETPSISGGRFLYEVNSMSLPYAFVVTHLDSANKLKGVSVYSERITVRSIESSFPLPYQIGQVSTTNALRSNPMALGNIWDAPVLITGATSASSPTGTSRVYEVYAASSLGSSMPAYFEYGLLASGCLDRNNPNSCSYRTSGTQSIRVREMTFSPEGWSSTELPGSYAPSRATPPTLLAAKGVSYYGRYWATPDVISNHIVFSYTNPSTDTVVTFIYDSFSPSPLVELSAPSSTNQIIRIDGVPYTIDGNKLNIFVFHSPFSFFPVRVTVSGDYAIASQASKGLAIITWGDILINGPLLSQNPHCQRPPILRRDADGSSYSIERGCSGPPPRQPLYLVSLWGNIVVNYLQPEVALNQVFLIAPRGAFRLSNYPTVRESLPSSRPLGLHLVGGLWVDTFGPWQTSSYPNLTWQYTFTALPLANDASLSLFPRARTTDPISTFLVK